MGNLMKYHAGDLSQLMDRINRHSIGMDDYFDKIFKAQASNYPPYNLVQLSNTESHLEVALAGFKKEEVSVYTEYGKLFIEGKKDTKEKDEDTHIIHQGLAQPVLIVPGQSQMTRKLDQLLLKMGFDCHSW